MKKLPLLTLSAFTLLGTIFATFSAPPAYAQETTENVAATCTNEVTFLGIPTWYRYLEVASVPVESGDPVCQVVGPCVDRDSGQPASPCFGENTNTRLDMPIVIQRVAIAILDALLRLAGIVAFGFIVFSGFKFVLSEGDANKAKDAQKTALNAAIGLGITIVATGVVSFIGRSISS